MKQTSKRLLNGGDLSNELLRTVFHQNHKRVGQRNQERRGKKREPHLYLTIQPLFSTTLHFWNKKGGRRTTPSLNVQFWRLYLFAMVSFPPQAALLLWYEPLLFQFNFP